MSDWSMLKSQKMGTQSRVLSSVKVLHMDKWNKIKKCLVCLQPQPVTTYLNFISGKYLINNEQNQFADLCFHLNEIFCSEKNP